MKSFYSVYSVQMYDVDCLIHSVTVCTLEPYTSSRFIFILSPIYPHVSQVVDYDDSFRLKLLGTACTSSAYPTHFNYKSFLQILCVWTQVVLAGPLVPSSAPCYSPWPIIFLSSVQYMTFLYSSVVSLKFELRPSVWKVLRIAFCGENWHCCRNKATLNVAIKMTNNVL
jgi:hypothetical protein